MIRLTTGSIISRTHFNISGILFLLFNYRRKITIPIPERMQTIDEIQELLDDSEERNPGWVNLLYNERKT